MATDRKRCNQQQSAWLLDEGLDLSKGDAFDVCGLADRLADYIRRGSPPFTISLSGSWGVGKSTFASALVERLRPLPVVIVDAWVEDVDHLQRKLAIEVGAKLGGKGVSRESIAKEMDDAIRVTHTQQGPAEPRFQLWKSFEGHPRLLAGLIALNLALFVLLITSAIWYEAATSALGTLFGASFVYSVIQSGLFVQFATTTRSTAPAQESVKMTEVFQKVISSKSKRASSKVIVIVDNLDRLEGADALRALGHIRSLVEVPKSRAVFLIPIDRTALARHIQSTVAGTRIGRSADEDKEAAGHDTAADYLEKFFNLDLLLTQPSTVDLRQWALEEAREVLRGMDEDDLAATAQVVASAAAGSPRSVKRILNGVAARRALLDSKSAGCISTPQLAFVEGVLVKYPEITPALVRDPREFQRIYTDVVSGTDKHSAIGVMTEMRIQHLRDFFLANTDVLPAPLVFRIALSLREDCFWRGVSDPTPLREALDAGRPRDFSDALDSLDPTEAEACIEGAVSYVERNLPGGFRRDAVTNLIGISESVRAYPAASRRLYPIAVRVFNEADDQNRLRVTRSLAEFLFDSEPPNVKSSSVAGSFAHTLTTTVSGDSVTVGLVWAIGLAGPYLSDRNRDTAREQLSKLSDELMLPLFEDPRNLWAISGPVEEKYGKLLEEWDAPNDKGQALIAAKRLSMLRRHDWNNPEILARIAARVATQVRLVPDTDDGFRLLDTVVRLVVDVPPCEEVDGLARALAEWPGKIDPAARMASVLELPISQEMKPTIETLVSNWLKTVDTDTAARLVIEHRQSLNTFGYDPGSVLVHQWASHQGQEWASLAASFDGHGYGSLLVDVLAGVAEPKYAKLFSQAVDLVLSRRDDDGARALVEGLAKRVKTMQLPAIEKLGAPLALLGSNQVKLAVLMEGLEDRIQADPNPKGLVRVLHGLYEQGLHALSSLCRGLATRTADTGGVNLDDLEWVARGARGSKEARRLVVDAIGSQNVPKLCPVVQRLEGTLRRNSEIRLALVRRANVASGQEAVLLLRCAAGWARPMGANLVEYGALLDSVLNRLPSQEVERLVDGLR